MVGSPHEEFIETPSSRPHAGCGTLLLYVCFLSGNCQGGDASVILLKQQIKPRPVQYLW